MRNFMLCFTNHQICYNTFIPHAIFKTPSLFELIFNVYIQHSQPFVSVKLNQCVREFENVVNQKSIHTPRYL